MICCLISCCCCVFSVILGVFVFKYINVMCTNPLIITNITNDYSAYPTLYPTTSSYYTPTEMPTNYYELEYEPGYESNYNITPPGIN